MTIIGNLKVLVKKFKSLVQCNFKLSEKFNAKFIKIKHLNKMWSGIPFSDLWQILVYHIQDTTIIFVAFHGHNGKFDFFSWQSDVKNKLGTLFKIASIFPRDICMENIDVLLRSAISLSLILVMVLAFSFISLFIRIVTKRSKKFQSKVWYSRATLAILLLIMYANQNIMSTLFSLVHCITISDKSHLFIHANTECWQVWQIVIILYMVFFQIPQCVVFLFGPSLIHLGIIKTWHFIASLFLPVQFVCYWVYLIIKNRSKIASQNCKQHSYASQSILEELYFAFNSNQVPAYICWMGVIEIRRMGLVLGHIFLPDKTQSCLLMIFICSFATISNVATKPYKNKMLNNISAISISCQAIVAIMSLSITTVNNIYGQVIEYKDELVSMWVIYIQHLFVIIVPLSLSSLIILWHMFRPQHKPNCDQRVNVEK